MFDSDLNKERAEQVITRRAFVLGASAVAAGIAMWRLRRMPPAETVAASGPPGEVTIVEFSRSGARIGTVRAPKIVMTEAEWRRRLSPNAFDITRLADTEIAYTGSYWNLHETGIFRCICCDTALFSSQAKFDSGTGWPSFWQPIAAENVEEMEDRSFGLRTAVACRRCDAHLGHLFDDGPPPTGLRYCVNSASLRFVGAV